MAAGSILVEAKYNFALFPVMRKLHKSRRRIPSDLQRTECASACHKSPLDFCDSLQCALWESTGRILYVGTAENRRSFSV